MRGPRPLAGNTCSVILLGLGESADEILAVVRLHLSGAEAESSRSGSPTAWAEQTAAICISGHRPRFEFEYPLTFRMYRDWLKHPIHVGILPSSANPLVPEDAERPGLTLLAGWAPSTQPRPVVVLRCT